MKAIYLKEMRSYFHSLAAYIYFALFICYCEFNNRIKGEQKVFDTIFRWIFGWL